MDVWPETRNPKPDHGLSSFARGHKPEIRELLTAYRLLLTDTRNPTPQTMNGPLSHLATLTSARTKRISSYDRTGGNADCINIPAGETVTIAEIDGPGVIRHIWVTISHPDPMYRRNVVLRMYWDGVRNPSVECPVGDFFGQGWGEHYNYVSLPLCASPREGRALNSYFPMPFADGARIEIENQSERKCDSFYYYIDYEKTDGLADDQGRFHALWNRSIHTPSQGVENEWAMFNVQAANLTDEFNHLIVEARGRGHYVGVNYYVDSPTPLWYGEGDDMWFIDGEAWPPSLHGTGTEDYFNTAWSPTEHYLHPYFGYARVNGGETGWLGRTHVYRFHLEDPIRFSKSLRGSIEVGHADCLTADVVTVAYWYQAPPLRKLAKLPPVEKRQNMPAIGAVEMHRWREAFRILHGGKAVWGNENLPKKVEKALSAKAKKTKLYSPEAKRAAEDELKKQKRMLKGKRK